LQLGVNLVGIVAAASITLALRGAVGSRSGVRAA
jgi:hypothetical protein